MNTTFHATLLLATILNFFNPGTSLATQTPTVPIEQSLSIIDFPEGSLPDDLQKSCLQSQTAEVVHALRALEDSKVISPQGRMGGIPIAVRIELSKPIADSREGLSPVATFDSSFEWRERPSLVLELFPKLDSTATPACALMPALEISRRVVTTGRVLFQTLELTQFHLVRIHQLSKKVSSQRPDLMPFHSIIERLNQATPDDSFKLFSKGYATQLFTEKSFQGHSQPRTRVHDLRTGGRTDVTALEEPTFEPLPLSGLNGEAIACLNLQNDAFRTAWHQLEQQSQFQELRAFFNEDHQPFFVRPTLQLVIQEEAFGIHDAKVDFAGYSDSAISLPLVMTATLSRASTGGTQSCQFASSESILTRMLSLQNLDAEEAKTIQSGLRTSKAILQVRESQDYQRGTQHLHRVETQMRAARTKQTSK